MPKLVFKERKCKDKDCSIIFVPSNGKQVFCCDNCYKKSRKEFLARHAVNQKKHKTSQLKGHKYENMAHDVLIFMRDGWLCYYCGIHLHNLVSSQITLDHAYPQALGGKSTASNLVTCCLTCNMKKSAKVDMFDIIEILKDINARNELFEIPSDLSLNSYWTR